MVAIFYTCTYLLTHFTPFCLGGNPLYRLKEEHELIKHLNVDSKRQPQLEVCDVEYFETLKNRLNDPEDKCDDVFGYLEVKVDCPEGLRFPVLPEHRYTNKNKTGTCKNFFDLTSKDCVYYSEELKFAIARGYVVTSVRAYCQYQHVGHYKTIIAQLKKEKMRGEGKDEFGVRVPEWPINKSLRTAAKLSQNSLFGKTIQFVNESVELVYDNKKLWKKINDSPPNSVTPTPVMQTSVTDVVEVKTKIAVVQEKSSCGIGIAILAEARMELYRYFELIESLGGEVLYCDTDSVVYAGHTDFPAEYLHDALYGKMKIELPPAIIAAGGFVGMSPKCYGFKLVDGNSYMKCKGVNLTTNFNTDSGVEEERDVLQANGEEQGLNFDIMRRIVMNESKAALTEQMQFVKKKDRTVMAYMQKKRLEDRFDKRRCMKNGRTLPWTKFNKFIYDGQIDVFANAVGEDSAFGITTFSDYLDHAQPEDIADFMKPSDKNSVARMDFYGSIFRQWSQSFSVSYMFYIAYLDEIASV